MAKPGKFEFDRNEKFLKGQELRRRILGPAYHDATAGMADDDPFLGPFRQLASEYCWGSVWSRPGLDEKTRRLINVALLTAGGRQHEVLTHVRGMSRPLLKL